jgi:hypothetical protein
MSIPRRHHFVQQAHLGGFTDAKGMLFVASKDGAVFSSAPRNVFAVRDLYSYDAEEGVQTAFETNLSQFEGDVFPFMKAIADTGVINEEGARAAAVYMACSMLRNPTYQKTVIDTERESVHAATALMDKHGKIPTFPNVGSKLDGRSITDLLRAGDVQIEINNARYLQALQHTLTAAAQGLGAFKLSVLMSDEGAFAIGDHPLTFLHPGQDFGPYGTPLGGDGCELTFPITKNVCLVGRWAEPLPPGNKDWIAQVNVRQAMFASRYVAAAASDDDLTRAVWRYTGLSFTGEVARLPAADGHYIITRRALLPSLKRQAVAGDIKALSQL